MTWHGSWLILFLAGSRHFESWMFETFSLQCKVWVSVNSQEVQFGMVFCRVKVVFCVDSLLLQATGAVRSILKRTFLEPSVAESLGERLWRNFA